MEYKPKHGRDEDSVTKSQMKDFISFVGKTGKDVFDESTMRYLEACFRLAYIIGNLEGFREGRMES